MSEHPWHNALRPSAFDDPIIAPTFNIQALQRVWAKADRPHVYGLFGPPGCGKTTTARILANALREEFRQRQGDPTAAIQVHEVNVADDNGVAFARALVEKMLLRSPCPVVWILDEVHQLTAEAQNVLLKTLEEPPAFAYFFLATTDAQKLKPAVLSRCHTINFTTLVRPSWYAWAKAICLHVGVNIPSPEILAKMFDSGGGHPRKLVQLLQTYAQTGELQDSIDIEGTISVPEIAKVLLIHGQLKPILAMLKEGTWDPEKLRRSIQGYVSAVLLNSTTSADLFRAKGILSAFVQGPQFYDRASFLVALVNAWEATGTNKPV